MLLAGKAEGGPRVRIVGLISIVLYETLRYKYFHDIQAVIESLSSLTQVTPAFVLILFNKATTAPSTSWVPKSSPPHWAASLPRRS